jgi:uncharacterized protein (DUF4213/DUF364 family)
MALLDDLLTTLPDGDVTEVRIGLNWTAVVVAVEGERRCGLASTLAGAHVHGTPDVPQAGRLDSYSGRELAALIHDGSLTLASVGMAAINALLPPLPDRWVEANAGDVIAAHGAGKHVALIGHFPFIPSLRAQVGQLSVLEQNPQPDELPANAAPDVLPRADVVAITGMTLINGTFEGLLTLCRPDALVLVLGPSTPLCPVLFDHGVHLLSGAVVTAIDPVLHALSQGAVFRQLHKAGVRLVNMTGGL